jgi:alanyl-tRNA synthetase
VWGDRPVAIRFVSAKEAATLPLRKEPQRTGELRVIDIDGYDLSACGGTHVARTGEIGVIAVRGWERFKGGSRIEFVCGGRALRSHRELRDIVNGSIRLLSVLPAELPAAIERAQSESKDLRKQSRDLTQRLAVHEAAAFASRAEPIGPISGVVEAVDGYDATGLKTLATSIVSQPGRVAALVSNSTPALAVIARSPDVSVDASAVLKTIMTRFGGKGGGRPDLAQGGGLNASPQEIVAALRELIAGG